MKKMLSVIGSIVLVALGVYVALSVLMVIFQSHFVYFPTPDIEATPAAAGLAYEDISFETSDGVRLSGWFVSAERPRGVILFCHGNGGNISHRIESIEIFQRLGMSVLIFDYRGYGRSDGKPSEGGTYRDAEAAWRYVTEVRNSSPSTIVIFGRSLGGAVAARLARKHKPGALIIESAFTSIEDLGAEMYPYLPIRLLSRFHYSTIEYLACVRCPILVVHSHDDEFVPHRHGQRLFKAANEPKQFLEINGGHNDGFSVSREYYQGEIDKFLSRYVRE
ncbi:MAG: alpha/beta hydrolase [Candidatus Zixiibacteriota bacterium]|nr:MAG: alpha/beta hydrolase [candidate division Zixibacteria bacterium]